MTAVMDAPAVGRALRRIAHEILERTPGGDDVVLLGIPSRGVILANRLQSILGDLGTHVPTGILDPGPFRDDLDGSVPVLDRTDVPFEVDARTVVLVDDVLATGRTIRAGLDALVALGRPRRVQVAVLVDRGHRELPIKADFVGKNLPTAPSERVAVRLDEHDGQEGVWIESPAEARL